MEKMYCISGLGADQRIFKRLSIKGIELVPLSWPPYDKHDEVSCYAQKISALIPDETPMILGLSFGGMLAVEIAKQRATKRIFLISSAKTQYELPKPSGLLKTLIKSNILPSGIFTMRSSFIYHAFGAETDDEKKLLSDILKDTDGHFMKWAFKALMSWHNTTFPDNIIHIHGTADKIIPPQNVKPNYWIEGGQHIMVYNRADEINKLIAANLNG